jgi:hypothetical protein
MVLKGAQSSVLQQLGVSYTQLVDYSSKDYISTLVSSINDLLTFTQIDVGSILHPGTGNMELHHHPVCTFERFKLDIVDALQSDGEISFFWQAERQSRWSPVRILFMLVSSCACSANSAQLPFSRTVTSRSLHILSTSTGA